MLRQAQIEGASAIRNRLSWGSFLKFVTVSSMVLLALLTGCSDKRAIGDINDQASVALISYETIEADISGIVYREVLDLPALLAATDKPVLLVFYQPGSVVQPQLIPLIEQFADDYREKAEVIFIDIAAKPSLASLYGVESAPWYVAVKSGSARLTMSGFDETTRAGLEELVNSVSDS